jgi:hypothetical protein
MQTVVQLHAAASERNRSFQHADFVGGFRHQLRNRKHAAGAKFQPLLPLSNGVCRYPQCEDASDRPQLERRHNWRPLLQESQSGAAPWAKGQSARRMRPLASNRRCRQCRAGLDAKSMHVVCRDLRGSPNKSWGTRIQDRFIPTFASTTTGCAKAARCDSGTAPGSLLNPSSTKTGHTA